MADASVLLGQLAEEFTAAVRAGQLPDVEDYARRHPALAERIRALFPTLLFLEGLAGGHPDGPAGPPTLAQRVGAIRLEPGQAFGPYRIERELGRGGMGVVYEATHQALGKRVALKVLPLLAGEGPAQLERFLREAQTAAGLHHTNIVPVFDIGQAAGLPYYAMQLIPGRGLDQLLSERSGGVSAAWFRRVAELGVQAAEGLAYAHARGVIHRDIKPSNLLLDERGVLWITDFGLARRADDPDLTHSGALVGTPRYMSPEQAQAARQPVDHRTDVYSLGASLYELLTGRSAFGGQTPVDVLLQVIEREPVAPRRLDRGIPRDLETVVLKAMAKRPADRYPTAAELADDLRRWLHTEPVRARRIGPLGRTVRWCRRNPGLAAVTGAAAVVILALSGLYAWSLQAALLDEQKARGVALNERDRALEAHERGQDHLCRSQYEQARTVLASEQPGRRWQALELLRHAERLRGRARPGGARPVEGPDPSRPRPAVLPGRAELRQAAVTALLTQDVRLRREWPGRAEALTPDNRWAVLARLEDDKMISRWLVDLTTGRQQPFARWGRAKEEGQQFPVALALSPDGKRIAYVEPGRPEVCLCEFPAGACRRLPDATALKGIESIRYTQLAFRPDGSELLAVLAYSGPGAWGRRVLAWDFTKPAEPRLLQHADEHGAVILNGSWVVWQNTSARTIRLSRADKAAKALPLECEGADLSLFSDRAALAPNQRLLAVPFTTPRSEDGSGLLVWDLVARREVLRLYPGSQLYWTGLVFSPDSGRLAAVDQHSVVHCFRLTGLGEELCQAKRPSGTQLLAWHADGRGLFSAKGDALQLWEPAWDNAQSVLVLHAQPYRLLAFSPDGRWIAKCSG
jgi:hypothetical protein